LIALTLGIVAWLILGRIIGDLERAAILVSLGSILFFSYGHLYSALEGWPSADLSLGRHRLLLPMWTLLGIVGARLSLSIQDLKRWTTWLTVAGSLLILMTLATMLEYSFRSQRALLVTADQLADPATGTEIELQASLERPDVYFIVLDAYGRSDSLKRLFDIDNSTFLNDLEELGFYVGQCSRSNYSQTELAFASTLNMAYLDDLGHQFRPDRDDRTPLQPLITHSLVRRLFEVEGYETVAFETGFPFSEITDADRYHELEAEGILGGLTKFERLLVRSSLGLALVDAASILPKAPQVVQRHAVERDRERTLLVLDTLRGMPGSSTLPRFVFAHIVSPHTPFVFGPDGYAKVDPYFTGLDSDRDGRFLWYRVGYSDQIDYLHQRLIPLLRSIITNSNSPPYIILQGDHGPEEAGSDDRMRILNAYYLPGGSELLYPEITPVNSFRVVFNEMASIDLPLLEDKGLFSVYNRPYDFTMVPSGSCADG
jgi:hypothetical protein